MSIFNSFVWRDKSILSFGDVKTFALNIPGTYPAWKINGEMITGILSPSISCFPKELEDTIKKNWIIEGRSLPDIFKAFEMKARLFLQKLKENYDLMIFVIRLPDAISHRILGDKKLILHYRNLGYKKIDNFLGEILKENNCENIVILSDHGLKFYYKVLNFPRWLEKKGLLYLNDVVTKRFSSIFLKFYDFIRPFIKIDLSKRIYNRFSVSQKRAREKLKERKLDFFDDENPSTFIQKLTSNMGALFLFGEDKKKKNLIKNALNKDKYIDFFIEYNRKSFPDFLIALKNDYLFIKEPSFFLKRKTEVFAHSDRGFFMAYGKSIIKGKMELINYKDFAPTVLKLFGINKPLYMKGNTLDIFKK